MSVFQLISNIGGHGASWSVISCSPIKLAADILLFDQSSGTRLSFSGVPVEVGELQRLVGILDDWLMLPRSPVASLDVAAELGGGFDQWLIVRFAGSADVAREPTQAVTVDYNLRGFKGEFAFATDAAGIRTWRDGLAQAIAAAEESVPVSSKASPF